MWISSSLQQPQRYQVCLLLCMLEQPAFTDYPVPQVPYHTRCYHSHSSQLPLPIGMLNVHLRAVLGLRPAMRRPGRKKKNPQQTKSLTNSTSGGNMQSNCLYSTAVSVHLCGQTMPCSPIYHCRSDMRLTNSAASGLNTFTNSTCQGVQEGRGSDGLMLSTDS